MRPPTRDWLRELMWSAARVSVPLGILLSGCRVSLAEPATGDACAPGVTQGPCEGQLVKVQTSLASGTVLTDEECQALCGHLFCQKKIPSYRQRCTTQGTLGMPSAPADSVFCSGVCVEGRPPREVQCPLPGQSVAELWARMAWFEAQSVVEFERLVIDLERLGAPDTLVTQARLAALDERRHAEVASRLAARPLELQPSQGFAPRTVEELAFDNFLGGCLNETAAAVRTAHQSLALGGAEGEALHCIANDEVRHAQFAWELHTWLISRVSPSTRIELAESGRVQLQVMFAADEDFSEEVRVATGRPSVAVWVEQLSSLARELWVPALEALGHSGVPCSIHV